MKSKQSSNPYRIIIVIVLLFIGVYSIILDVSAQGKTRLNTSNVSILKGKTYQLKVIDAQKGAKITWKSNNNAIVTVNTKGLVKAIKKGEATIIATIKYKKGELKLKCKINVTEPKKSSKRVVMYYTNWSIYSNKKMALDNIPWNKLTHINHTFWTVNKDFKVAPVDKWADLQWNLGYAVKNDGTVCQIQKDSNGNLIKDSKGNYKLVNSKSTLSRSDISYTGEFATYMAMKEKYKNVKVLISVGGWTRSENFHDMASSKDSRKIFINSIIDLIKNYPFIDGIDIDWEYPGINRKADPNDPTDRGCPGDSTDKANFTALLTEMRVAFNKNGWKNKLITICEQSDALATEKNQDLKAISEVVDYINIMSYDVHGGWESVTGALSPLYGDKYSIDNILKIYLKYFTKKQINIGTPFYARGWSGVNLNTKTNSPMGQVAGGNGGEILWNKCKKLEKVVGWIKGYDSKTQSAWLYNSSEKKMYTYENEKSLQAKIDYVNKQNLGGMLVWDISGDSAVDSFPMTKILSKGLLGK